MQYTIWYPIQLDSNKTFMSSNTFQINKHAKSMHMTLHSIPHTANIMHGKGYDSGSDIEHVDDI